MKKQTDTVPDSLYLLRRGRTWYERYPVPTRLRATIGRADLVQSLRTRDFTEARERRWGAIEAFRRQLEEAEGAVAWDPVKLGLEHREHYLQASPELENLDEDPSDDNLSERADIHHEITIDVDELRDAGRRKDAALLYRIATAETECVLTDAERRWLAEIDDSQKERSIMLHCGVFAELHRAYPEAVLASDIDRRKAGTSCPPTSEVRA